MSGGCKAAGVFGDTPCTCNRPTDMSPQNVNMAQYADPDLDVEGDELLMSLLTMGTRNRNEAAFMLHMAPWIAAHLHREGWVKAATPNRNEPHLWEPDEEGRCTYGDGDAL